MRPMMKVLYLTMALVLSCVVPTYSMSMQELQNTSHYEMLRGFGESGNGDGTYIDKDSIKAEWNKANYHHTVCAHACW